MGHRALIVLVLLTCLSLPAKADFDGIHSIVMHSAATLQDQEVMIGLFAPLGYGINDDLSIFLHPVLALLLTPNLYLRRRVLAREKVDLSIQAGYIQSFLDSSRVHIPGVGHLLVLATYYPSKKWSFTAHAGYLLSLSPMDHGVQAGVDANWLVTPADMITMSISEQWSYKHNFHIPYGLLVYTHAFDYVRISAGLAFSNLPLQVGPSEVKIFPIFPVIDVWWRL